jgi:hypothetical protein
MTAIYDLASIDALSGVDTDSNEPFVQLRANSSYEQGRSSGDNALDAVLVGQLDPPAARDLAMSILEAADAAEFDAMLYTLMLRRLGEDPNAQAKASAILADLRAEREQRR